MRTTLASGAWIEHRPIQDLKGKDKRLLAGFSTPNFAGAVSPAGDVDVDAILAGMDVLHYVAGKQEFAWALVLTAWSFDLPLPTVVDKEVVNAESFGELPLDDFEQLEDVFAPYEAKLSRQPDPKGGQSATTSSSNGLSRASAAPIPPTA